MARAAPRDGPSVMSRPSSDGGEVCPVCSSGSYLNQNLEFKLNPECYHKMCEGCVDRVFRNGPALCPYQGCNKTLRYQRFRKITFADIKVEKEVDTRRRMAKIFNKREEDFESLMAYNNYLNQVEDIIFDLISGTNVEQRNREINEYQARESRSIAENADLSTQESSSFRAQQAAEQSRARERREAAVLQDELDKKERLEGRMDYINKLAQSDGNARKIAIESQKVRLQKAQARRVALNAAPTTTSNGVSFAGLRKKMAPEEDKPYDPFGGYTIANHYFMLEVDLPSEQVTALKKDPAYSAGGYDTMELCNRALTEAFAGLAVFIGEESIEQGNAPDRAIASESAAVAANDVF